MATLPVHFVRMNNMPLIEGVYLMPKPLNHPNNSNKIIISSDSHDRGIYELDLISNKLKLLYKYDRVQIETHQHLIHSKTKTLFIFGGGLLCGPATFNLATTEMNYDHMEDGSIISCYISNKDEFHIIGKFYTEIRHQIWRFDKNEKMNLISWQPLEFELDSELIYVPFQEKLIALRIADFCIEIWECKLNASNQNDLRWNKNGIVKKIKQYDAVGIIDVILGFENILFMFYFDLHYNLEIWCYHLLHQKSYKSKHKVSKMMKPDSVLYVIKDSNNNAHILDFVSGKHIKIDLFELIPNELKKAHEAFYEPLVMGYSKKTNLPIVLKKMIVKFYPL